MFARDHNLGVPLFEFPLFDCLLFCDHIVSSHKDSLEELIFAECGNAFDFLNELRFAFLLGPVLLLLKHLLGDLLLPVVRNHQFVLFGLWRLLRVRILIFFLV